MANEQQVQTVKGGGVQTVARSGEPIEIRLNGDEPIVVQWAGDDHSIPVLRIGAHIITLKPDQFKRLDEAMTGAKAQASEYGRRLGPAWKNLGFGGGGMQLPNPNRVGTVG